MRSNPNGVIRDAEYALQRGAGFGELASAAVTPGVDAGCIYNQISIFGRMNPNFTGSAQ